MNKVVFTALTVFTFCIQTRNSPYPAFVGNFNYEDTVYFIAASRGGLKLREKPDLKSRVITLIPDGDIAALLETTEKGVSAEKKSGRFHQVQWQGKTGFAPESQMDDGRNVRTGIADPLLTAGYNIFQNKNKVLNPSGKRYFHILTVSNPNAFTGNSESCNHKYGGIYCYSVVYETSSDRLIYHDTVSHGYWDGWLNDDEVLIRSNFGDEGMLSETYTVFNVKTGKNRLEIFYDTRLKMDSENHSEYEYMSLRYRYRSKIYSAVCRDGNGEFGTLKELYENDLKLLETFNCESLTFPEKYDGLYFNTDSEKFQILPLPSGEVKLKQLSE